MFRKLNSPSFHEELKLPQRCHHCLQACPSLMPLASHMIYLANQDTANQDAGNKLFSGDFLKDD